MAPQLLRLHLLEGHSRRNTAFLLPARLYFALFQRFLSPMDSSGCSQRSGDAGGDVVSHGSSARPSLPIPPSDPSAPKTASDSSWDHSEGLVVISVVVIALVVTSQPCYPFHVPLVPNTPLPFPQESFIRERGLFLTLWLFPSLFPQPVPIPAPDPIPCACSWWDSIPGSRWLLMAVTPQPGALPQGWPRVVLLPAGVNPLGKQRFPVGSCWECCQGGCTEVKLSPELSSSSVVSARLKCLLG